MTVRFLIVVSFVVTGSICYAQEFIAISGKVIDAETKNPVPFANIQLLNKSIGTSSNAIGEFLFKVTSDHVRDTIIISSIGYKRSEKIIHGTENKINISLQPATIQLAEITIKGETALELLLRAIAKIPELYDSSDYHLTAFYRENIGLADYQLTYNESVLDIFKTFKTGKHDANDQLKVLKGRKRKIEFKSDQQFYYWISGISNGARSALGQDGIKNRNSKLSFLNPANFKRYNFSYGEPKQNGDRNLIVIDMLPKSKSTKALYRCKFYIDQGSLAIVKIELQLTKAGVDYVEKKDQGFAYAIMTKVVHATLDYHRFQIDISYKEFKGKWYLSTVTRNFQILVNSKRRNMHHVMWHADMNFQVTDLDLSNKNPITEGNIGNSSAAMGNMIGNDTDEAFWQNFNIVKQVVPDSLKGERNVSDSSTRKRQDKGIVTECFSNRENGFTRADSLRGKLTPLRTCYDVKFYHLDVAVDLDRHAISGSNIIRFEVQEAFNVMQVDLYANMKIQRILYHNRDLTYYREYDAVFIKFPETLSQHTLDEIRIFYEGVPQVPNWKIPMNGGVLWDKDEAGNPWVQMVCQGSGASLWWPNKDHLSDEPDSMKIWITVPTEFTEISNGRLKKQTAMEKNRTRYEWFVSYPINNYNVTFNLGKYAHYREYLDSLSLDYYVMPYNLAKAKEMFKQVIPMIQCYEKRFGKYPFSRDGFMLVESLYPMEHQSGVCIGKINAANANTQNPLIWHESAHEWWGNAVSCSDLADMWIHESFATYAESLYIECQYDKNTAQLFLNEQKPRIKNHEPIVGVRDVNHIYYEIEDMYSKGSLVLNTFRNALNNDSVWFSLLLNIQNNFRYKTLTTDELISFINRELKTDFTPFFDQYLKYKSLPELDLELIPGPKNLTLKYRWKTDVTDFLMPVIVTTSPGHFERIIPENKWKTKELSNMDSGDFEVNEDEFLITVNIKG